MNALYIRSRFEWAIIGFSLFGTFTWLAYHILQTEGPRAGGAATIAALFGLAIGRQLIFFPPNISLKKWWLRSVSPGYYGIPWTGGGVRIIRPNGPNGNIIFDLNGNCVGDEDYVIGKWHFHRIDSDCRYNMPIIAYWRTKRRKPTGMR